MTGTAATGTAAGHGAARGFGSRVSGSRGRVHGLRSGFRGSRGRVRGSGPAPGSVPGGAVDALADQVGVTVVAGVLLDHVGVDPAQAEGLVGEAAPALGEVVQSEAGREPAGG